MGPIGKGRRLGLRHREREHRLVRRGGLDAAIDQHRQPPHGTSSRAGRFAPMMDNGWRQRPGGASLRLSKDAAATECVTGCRCGSADVTPHADAVGFRRARRDPDDRYLRNWGNPSVAIFSKTAASLAYTESGTGQCSTNSVRPNSVCRPAQSTKASTEVSGYSGDEPWTRTLSSSATSRPAASHAAVSFCSRALTMRRPSSTEMSPILVASRSVTQPCAYCVARLSPRGPVAAT